MPARADAIAEDMCALVLSLAAQERSLRSLGVPHPELVEYVDRSIGFRVLIQEASAADEHDVAIRALLALEQVMEQAVARFAELTGELADELARRGEFETVGRESMALASGCARAARRLARVVG